MVLLNKLNLEKLSVKTNIEKYNPIHVSSLLGSLPVKWNYYSGELFNDYLNGLFQETRELELHSPIERNDDEMDNYAKEPLEGNGDRPEVLLDPRLATLVVEVGK